MSSWEPEDTIGDGVGIMREEKRGEEGGDVRESWDSLSP